MKALLCLGERIGLVIAERFPSLMIKPDFKHINELITKLDRIFQEAQELREKIAILTEQRRSWPEPRQQSARFPEPAQVNDSTTRPRRPRRK